ncbi:MAG: fasciclin domain-containing protein [Phycisphaerales bacterium]
MTTAIRLFALAALASSAAMGVSYANGSLDCTGGGATATAGSQATPPAPAAPAAKADIVDVAVAAPNFKTLVAALKAAGLVEALKAEGPFTVFAPTDEAFAKLPKGTLDMLLMPENKDKLVAILKYHVVPGRVLSTDAAKGASVKSLQGTNVTTKSADGKVWVENATVVKADIVTSNGVIHVIDTVIMPKN